MSEAYDSSLRYERIGGLDAAFAGADSQGGDSGGGDQSWVGFPSLNRVTVRDVSYGSVGGGPRRRVLASVDGWTRMLDMAVAAMLLCFLLPVFAVVSLVIFAADRGPIFYAHRRQGKEGRPFNCLKFRSMVVDSEEQLRELLERDPAAREEWERDHKLRRDPRVTRVGSFLRRSSLDELPQLINVLRGEMSLVGPRPIVEAEVTRYARYIHYYYQIKPGMTGLWQVSGRNDTSYRRRIAMDTVYARRQNATLNLLILVMTLPSVLKRKGAC